MNMVPADTRYVPIRQMPYCCVPACLQMVMLRKGHKLIPQEVIGQYLGLTVPPTHAKHFCNVRVSENPPATSGFGTQIQNEQQFGLNQAFKNMDIPLEYEFLGSDGFESEQDFTDKLNELLANDEDVLACLNIGILADNPDTDWGHVMVVDKVTEEKVRMMESDISEHSHWRTFPLAKVYQAIKHHTSANQGGLWWIKDTRHA